MRESLIIDFAVHCACDLKITSTLGFQVDADKTDVGGDGEVDFKENAKFGSHMKEKGEAASEFSKSKTLGEQRQYLPIYSVRDELLQVTGLAILTSCCCINCDYQ